MPLLSSPATISDGTSPHVFTFQNQIQVGKSIVSTYKELAAPAVAAATFRSKYDPSNPFLNRNVAQVNRALIVADGSYKLATINISAVYHKQHTIAELTLLGITAKNVLLEASFWSNFFNQI